jgi:hypothetical protein
MIGGMSSRFARVTLAHLACLVSALAVSAAASPQAASQPVAGAAVAACQNESTALCLNSSRFRVTMRFTTSGGPSTDAQAVPLTTDTGYFWFFDEGNVETVVKVLNGCALNQRYWVFAGGLTDVEVVLTITDTVTGQVKTYSNLQGTAFQPIQDTSAFATCP